MKKKISQLLVLSIIPTLLINTSTYGMTDVEMQAEMRKYDQPISTIAPKTNLNQGRGSSEGQPLTSECIQGGDYTPVVPSVKNMDASSVTSVEYYSPERLNKNWIIWDHIGVTDTAFQGKRHVVRRDTGIQWFGYDKPPYNDMILRDFSDVITTDSFTINVKQAPVRADWHTINGSGILFGVTVSGTAGNTGDVLDPKGYLSGYAFVATNKYNELRYYNNVAISEFLEGKAGYILLRQEDKLCNSQSLTITHESGKMSFKLGTKDWGQPIQTGAKVKGYQIKATNTSSSNITNGATSIDFTVIPPGKYAGAMVDYASHSCPSLSSVYMFNYTVNDVNYF